jgi:MFS superfamily sulfate permease-like transporter
VRQQFGLYAAIGHCFLYPLFGSSRELSNGPCAIMALLTSQFGKAGITGDTRAAVLLTFICGVTQIAMAVMNIGMID